MITDKDIKKLKEVFATKDDLKRFATKDDLKRFATKDDLKRFATKDDLKRFAAKDDLKRFATKDDLNILQKEMMKGFKKLTKMLETTITFFDNNRVNHEKRLMRIEKKLDLPPYAD